MEVADKVIKIETEQLLNDFKQHLDFGNNKRILFSGPFGTGKSTFLNEFSEKENDDFFYLKIFPVNYSVSNNEDVFELIKFDLLLQLMGNYYEEINLKKEDFTLLLKSQVFIMERMKFMPLLYAILGLSEKLGTPIVDFIKALKETVGDFETFSNEMKVDEENDITAFLQSIEQKTGSHHEMDAVSELILDLIARIKAVKGNVQSVLIIDDLDRLDPEHIFRLFNIFSAHYDEINGENKFGFDKVIFVCDIENIRKIFHHKYGQGVDFSGYIDKFYSIKPFDFDNRKYIQEKVVEFIKLIQFEDKLYLFRMPENQFFLKTLKSILISLIESKQLNLRVLINPNTVTIEEKYFKGDAKSSMRSVLNTPVVVLFYVLKNFYASFEILHERMNKLNSSLNKETITTDPSYSNFNMSEDCTKGIVSFCLPFILSNEGLYTEGEGKKACVSAKYNCTIHYNDFPYSDYNFHNFQKATRKDVNGEVELHLNPFQILLDTFEICKKNGLLK
ncbi:hypothetical protein FEDK69T_31410 [Flavobacterium enshiense DK69]|uniref:P-loop NTPase fold protein n=1 Tax=Flavobacterium enshiense TaxID=1341165 RepID=UPI0003C617F4|nr:P-loop NTPase fold protein [Flavobacterium enshiense]ESU19472.1 hypothetical protein FEDK69T_31410 [Flavobacterium enshiense DK69]